MTLKQRKWKKPLLGRLTCRPLWAKTSSYWDLHVNKSCQWKPKFCTVVVSRFMNKRTWGAPCTNYAKHLLRVMQNAFNVTHQWIQASFEATESSKPLNCDQSVQTKKRIFPFCGAVHTLTPELTHVHGRTDTHFPTAPAEPAVSNFLTLITFAVTPAHT